MQTNLIIIIVGAVALVLGALLGYLGAMFGGQLDKSLEDARSAAGPEEQQKEQDHQKSIEQDTGLHVVEQDVLRVSLDAMLRMQVDVDGERLDPNGLTAEQRTRLVNIVVQIRPWIEGKVIPASSFTALVPAPVKMSPPPVAAPPLHAEEAPPLRVNAMRGFRSWLESDIKKPEPLLKNDIVKQIDEVLQKNLEDSPFASKHIRLEDGPTGEVVVYVGALRYPGVDAVPDEAIRTIIQKAIKEWNDQ